MSKDGASVRAAPLAYLVGLGLSPWYLPPSAQKCVRPHQPLSLLKSFAMHPMHAGGAASHLQYAWDMRPL